MSPPQHQSEHELSTGRPGSWEAERTLLSEAEYKTREALLNAAGFLNSPDAETRFVPTPKVGEIVFKPEAATMWLQEERECLAHKTFQELLFSYEDSLANKRIYLPLIDAAVNGDQDVRDQYEDGRLIHYDDFPAHLRRVVFKHVEAWNETSKLVAQQEIDRVELADGPMPLLRLPFDERDISALGLRTFLTFSHGREITSLLENEFQAKDVRPIVYIKSTGQYDCQTMLRVTSDTIVGVHARNAFREGTALLFALRVLDDYLTTHNLVLSDAAEKKIASQLSRLLSVRHQSEEDSKDRIELARDPWKLLSSPPLSDVIALVEIVEALGSNCGHPELIDHGKLVSRFLLLKDPVRKLEEHIARCLTASSKATKDPTTESNLPQTNQVSERQQFIEAVVDTLTKFIAEPENEPERTAKHLWSLRIRGADTTENILKDLRKGVSGSALIQSLRSALRARTVVSTAPAHEQKSEQREDHKIEDEQLRLTIHFPDSARGRNLFFEWRKNLSQAHQRKVDTRLERLENGFPGHMKPTRSPNIFELKFCPSGLRIFFAYGPTDQQQQIIWILGGMSKEDGVNQDAYIKIAEKEFLALLDQSSS